MFRGSKPRKVWRLLLIDDDEGLQELFRVAMTKEGFEVACASDGALGLAKIPVFHPDFILLDVMMPNLNGFEVLHRMQAERIHIPTIVITGYSDPANEQILRQEPNVLDYFTKPVRFPELAARIRAHLESGSPRY